MSDDICTCKQAKSFVTECHPTWRSGDVTCTPPIVVRYKARCQQWVKGVCKEATEKKKHTRDDIVDQHVEHNKKAKLF
jgi:hypothetical protein